MCMGGVGDVIHVLVLYEAANQLAKTPPAWEGHRVQGACYLTKPLGLFCPKMSGN